MEVVSLRNKQKKAPELVECRACLTLVSQYKATNIFTPWPWDFSSTVVLELEKLVNIEVPAYPSYPKHICFKCESRLRKAIMLVKEVKQSENIIKSRFSVDSHSESNWPKPIQVDKNVNEVLNNTPDIEIKEEIISNDDEDERFDENMVENMEADEMDIKIEPEEIVQQSEIKITVNGTISQDELDKLTLKNGCEVYENEEYLESNGNSVKEEPVSEEEISSDIPLECMLCTKKMHTVSGLKAHVMTHHNYKTVKRKSDNSVSPAIKRSIRNKPYNCPTCKRSFATSTDLIVHEVCHNKVACYGCNAKFNSFKEVAEHRRRCKVKRSSVKPRTLTDILRERVVLSRKMNTKVNSKALQVRVHCLKCSKLFENIIDYKLHKQTYHKEEKECYYSEDNENIEEQVNHPNDDSVVNSNDEEVKENLNDNKIEIEIPNIINVKRISVENKEKTEEIIKKEKQDAEYHRIETELESIFDIAVEKRHDKVGCESNEDKPIVIVKKEIKQEKSFEEILSQQFENDTLMKEDKNANEYCNGDNINKKDSLPEIPTMDIVASELPNNGDKCIDKIDVSTQNNDNQQLHEPMELEKDICFNIEQNQQNDTSEQTSEESVENIHINNETQEEGIVVVNIEKNEVSNIFFYEKEDLENKIELNKAVSEECNAAN